jgi:non-ribosomal peptide synthetase component F
MSLIWMVIIPAAVTAAWFRYRLIAAETTRPASPKPFLSNPAPENPWGTHSHQQDTQWLHELFERSAATFPELTALSVASTGETLSYRALNERAEQFKNRIGFYLSGPDQVVAVRLEQNTADIVAIHLAILKAGGVQLFLDPEAPEAACQQTLLDAAPVLLISDESVAGLDVPVLRPDELQPNQYADAATSRAVTRLAR